MIDKTLESTLKNTKFADILGFNLNAENLYVFDFTENNRNLKKVDLTNTSEFKDYIFTTLHNNNSRIGVGGYNENRSIYKRSSVFAGEEPRTVHLGIDIWAEAGTPVFAPLDGIIHSFKNNSSFGDYGPTIILEHNLNDIKFYTLYGHLSLSSIDNIHANQKIDKGSKLAELGNSQINVGWPPHLHFQLITDMLNKNGDFPGVAELSKRKFYLNICPDPNLILKINILNK